MITLRIFLIVLSLGSVAHAQQFQSPITDTHWQVIETPLECSLIQHIPDYGEAKFSQSTGDDLSLSFTTSHYPASQNNAHFEIAAAVWQNSDERIALTSLPTEAGQTVFELKGQLAKQALTQLQQGLLPALRYHSPSSFSEVDVLMSTVHLSDSISGFQHCIANLHPDTFESVRKLTIHFGLEQSRLNADAEKALTRLANYVKVDNSIKRIIITGHTDNHGRKRLNGPLSERRAAAVKQFLIEKGQIPEQLITTSAYIEKKPLASNKTDQGRALNRRAEITLIR
ncbi:MAG: OmpA family protein [Gammaproteobacteria bacterium]|nr:OmpA family protein [Gammaproteobacteria bacterium]